MTRSQDPKIERRSEKRFRTGITVHVEHGDGSVAVDTHDIGMNGLSCHLPQPLSLFTKYGFRLFVPISNEDHEEIDGEGIVVRVEEVEIEGELSFETAFFFQQLDPGHYKILDSYLKRIDGKNH